jgi:superfamily I DNA/RNA helicase
LADRHPETDFACAYKQNIKTRDKQSIYVNASRALKEMRASMLPESDNDSTGLTAHSIEELEKKLNEAEREIAELKAIVAKHETIDQDRKAKVVNFLTSL